jgi:hypothetical protein
MVITCTNIFHCKNLQILPNFGGIFGLKINHLATLLQVIVAADPARPDRRHAIRETWGKDHDNGFKMAVIFLLGLTHNSQV